MKLIKKIVVKRSAKRRKSISAKLKDGVMEVRAPIDISEKQLNKIIEKFKHRFEKRKREDILNRENELVKRAQELSRKYFHKELEFKSIKYSASQRKRFGSCSTKRTIWINECLKKMPQWVKDYVIIHELAHLIYPNHSKKFWEQVNKYPKTERAIGYLMAKGIDTDEKT